MILLFIVIFIGKHIYEIHNYNQSAVLDQLQYANKEEINELLKERKPLLIHNLGNKYEEYNNLSFQKISEDNPGHIIHDKNRYLSLKSFVDEKQIYIYKNENLYDSLRLKQIFDGVYEPFQSIIHCNKKYYLSLLKGLNSGPLTHNKHNIHLINQIYGSSKIYLFNPKHKSDIINKDNQIIKKYGQKINLSQGLVLYIPIEWYYLIEIDNESIIGEIEADNYFTLFYNNLR
tara:strand:- start:2762 stop:3454 length:693 start_codon:yes stop_codon:yes gene_type:complete